jgi:uncharacterized protein YfdQ (DUF2303 family)
VTDLNSSTIEYISDLAVRAEIAEQLEPGSIYAFMHPHGTKPEIVSLRDDQYLDEPRRKRGSVHVTDVTSLAAYHAKHGTEHTEVFADLDAATITAVLNAHSAAGPDWQDHRVTLTMRMTPQWITWTGQNRVMMSQQAFAEFLEDNAADIAADGPVSAADLIELAQEFHAHTKVTFASGKRLKSGETQFVYTESTEAKAGERGTIAIPDEFELALRPLEDCDLFRIKARFRYRLREGQLTLGYHIDDPAQKFRSAVDEVVELAEGKCGVKVMRGRPG